MNIDICRKGCPYWVEKICRQNDEQSVVVLKCIKIKRSMDSLSFKGAKHLAISEALKRNGIAWQVKYGEQGFDDVSHSILEHFIMAESLKNEENVPEDWKDMQSIR